MDLYRFSPIESQSALADAIAYVATECTWLFFNVTGFVAPIRSLTIFAHYPDEYDALVRMQSDLGELRSDQNGPRIKLADPIVIEVGVLEVNGVRETVTQTIEYLRIRRPDPYRMQVGCCDYEIEDYWDFKEFFGFRAESPRTIQRRDYEMLEFFDPSSDVLGYAVSGRRTGAAEPSVD
jgi:hypothetical protein